MRVTIFGTGYVGLVTGACLAEVGNDVLCIDVDTDRVATLKRGEIPIFEPDLDTLIKRNVAASRLTFSTDAAAGISHGRIQFIAVGTPPEEDGAADLSHVLSVVQTIGEHLNDYSVVVNKSTVPVGTADQVRAGIAAALAARRMNCDFAVVSNPEFLKEGAAVSDFMKPDRIVLGSENPKATALLKELYAPFNRNRDRIITMDVRSAELTKYAANAMLATKISFMNEMANLAEKVGADIEQVRQGIGSDSRIGFSFIYPGVGYGGSCFPKDISSLSQTGRSAGYETRILDAVEAVNREQKNLLFNKICAYYNGDLAGKTIALWGLSFKPNTDDVRDAPSRNLMEALWAAGARVRAFDPVAMEAVADIYGERDDLALCDSPEAATEGADALAIITEWRIFQAPNFDDLKASLSAPVIFDGRNLFDPQQMADRGFCYHAIGRGEIPEDSSLR